MKEKTLSDEIDWYHKRCEQYLQEIKDLKESHKLEFKNFIKRAERRLKEEFDGEYTGSAYPKEINKIIDKIFKEEFGGKLVE